MAYDKDLCSDACKNPHCPYITQINLNTQANAETRQVIAQINKALESLLGEDLTGLNGGVIRTLFDKISELAKCQQRERTSAAIQKSWVSNLKAFGALVVSVALTAVLEYWLLKGF